MAFYSIYLFSCQIIKISFTSSSSECCIFPLLFVILFGDWPKYIAILGVDAGWGWWQAICFQSLKAFGSPYIFEVISYRECFTPRTPSTNVEIYLGNLTFISVHQKDVLQGLFLHRIQILPSAVDCWGKKIPCIRTMLFWSLLFIIECKILDFRLRFFRLTCPCC